jgi:hypothetical protein
MSFAKRPRVLLMNTPLFVIASEATPTAAIHGNFRWIATSLRFSR